GNGGNQIGCARAAGTDTDTELTGRTGVALSSMTAALLVAAEHMAQPVAIFPHRIVERHGRAARNAKHYLHTLTYKRLAHDLRAGSFLGHADLLVGSR